MPNAPRTSGTLWALSKRIAREGVSFANAWQSLEDAFGEKRLAEFQQVYRMAAERLRTTRTLAGADREHVPTAESIARAPVNLPGRYLYTVAVQGVRPGTTDRATVHVNVVSSRRITLGNAITTAIAAALLDPELYSIEPDAADVVAVEESADYA